jgi:hypothetical protein
VAEQQPDPALQPYWPAEPAAQAGEQQLYRLTSPHTISWAGQAAESEGVVTLLGYQIVEILPGEITLLTAWQVREATDRPLKIFVHASDQTGAIAGQWDGLDVQPTSWQAGDIFIQLHRFTVPAAADSLRLTTGLYDGTTLERLVGPLPLE